MILKNLYNEHITFNQKTKAETDKLLHWLILKGEIWLLPLYYFYVSHMT